MNFTKQFLAHATAGKWIHSPDDFSVTEITQDSRHLKQGSLFVALRTENRDGHDFIKSAQNAGAAAALVEKEISDCSLPQLIVADTLKAFQAIAEARRNAYKGKIIGITGSAGKTSTKDLLKILLGEHTHATVKNLNNFIGVPLTLCALQDDAPFAVIEAGISVRGEMESLARMIRPDIALTTMIGASHLEFLESESTIAEEKSVLSQCVSENGIAFFPASCLRFKVFDELKSPRICLFKNGDNMEAILPNDFIFEIKEDLSDATVIELWQKGKRNDSGSYKIPRKGEGMITNAALSIIAAKHLGINDDTISSRLLQWKPSHFRGEWISDGKRTLFVDCYNANPSSVREAWQVFQKQSDPKKPRLYLLGSMAELGKESKALHQKSLEGLTLRPQDSAVLIGNDVSGYATALVNAGAKLAQISFAKVTVDAQDTFNKFEGNVLIKGSRIHTMEMLLTDLPFKAQDH